MKKDQEDHACMNYGQAAWTNAVVHKVVGLRERAQAPRLITTAIRKQSPTREKTELEEVKKLRKIEQAATVYYNIAEKAGEGHPTTTTPNRKGPSQEAPQEKGNKIGHCLPDQKRRKTQHNQGQRPKQKTNSNGLTKIDWKPGTTTNTSPQRKKTQNWRMK